VGVAASGHWQSEHVTADLDVIWCGGKGRAWRGLDWMEVEEDELGMCWIGVKVLSFMLC